MSAKYSTIFISVILSILLTDSSNAACFETLPFSYKDGLLRDSTNNKKKCVAVKINPVQMIFCELPVSFEVFGKQRYSLQFQVGYIFPKYDALLQQFMLGQGHDGDATNTGIFSYRTSPFNNYGVSTKVELRKYGKSLYYGFQLMYKYCYYNKLTFTLEQGGTAFHQTESKDSNIGGIGFILGRQSKRARVVFDWYLCAGMRHRSMNIVIHEKSPYFHPQVTSSPSTSENSTSVYPFVNIGSRIGLKFGQQ
jgi:hypothetical protein